MKTYTDILCSLLKWLLSGDMELKEELDMNVLVQSETISAFIMYNMKSDRQARYLQDRMFSDRNLIAIDILCYIRFPYVCR